MIFEPLTYDGKIPIRMFEVSIYNREMHFHTGIEILFVMKGEVEISITDTTILKENDIFIVESNVLHRLRQKQNTNSIFAIQFDTRFANSYFPELSGIRFAKRHITPDDEKTYTLIKDTLKEFIISYTRTSYGVCFRYMSVLNRLLYIMIDVLGVKDPLEKDRESAINNYARLNRIIEYIHKEYMHNITLTELSKNENLNVSYLSNFIKKQMGISFQRYLKHVRAENAARQLIYTNKRLIDITFECGFSDTRYLNKAFYEEYGVAPKDYRRHPTIAAKNSVFNDSQHELSNLNEWIEVLLSKLST